MSFDTITKALKNNMREILINLPDELVEYLDSNPYIGDRSEFIAMLIKRWQKEVEKSRRETEQSEKDPRVIKDFYK